MSGMGGVRAPLFEDDFDGAALDETKWLPAYLPHWSSLEATRPTLAVRDGVLALGLAPEQGPWCPEFDGAVRVSNLQTGHFSGPEGSAAGQHRFREGLVVRSALPERRLFVDRHYRLEMRARARLGPTHLAALWLIGFEDRPERSGEITVMEVFGRDADAAGMALGHGIKRIHDPRLRDEVAAPRVSARVEDWHDYGIDWRADGVTFLLDGEVLSRSRQSPDYPMQLMLNLYDIPSLADGTGGGRPVDPVFEIDRIRAWRD